MKIRLFLKNKKAQRGVALIFTLGILGLMVVLALTFASLSFTDQNAARSSAERYAAKLMAKSAVERVIAVLENNNTITDTKLLVSGGDPNNTNHFDFLWKLITYHGDVPGAGEMRDYIEKTVRTGTNSPYWQYVLAPNKEGKDEIIGRFAYMAYLPVGLLDPIASAMTGSEGSTPIERPGMVPDEIDLSVLAGVSVPGGNGALAVADLNKLGGHNADTSYPDVVGKPADLFSRFTDGTNTALSKYISYAPLKDKLTSAWFTVPRAPAQPERYAVVDGDQVKHYPRFNLNRTPEEWAALTLDDLILSEKQVLFETLNASEEDSFNKGTVIPWFMKNDDDTRQIAANFLSYFSPMPVTGFDAKKIWGALDETAAYTGNMRTPYLNDVLIDVSLNMTVTDSGDQDLASYTKTFTVTITPKIDLYIELADLYGNSLNDMGILTFKIPALLKSLKTATSSNASIVYSNGDMTGANANLTSAEFQKALNSKINSGTLSEVFPVYKHEITAATPFTATITVNVTREEGADGSLGAPKCDAVEFSEALSSFVMDKITILMSAKPGANTIPIDLANIAAETTYPVLGEKSSDSLDFTSLPPFKLNINASAGYADESQRDQERHITLRYRAIDSAANLKLEHWVKCPVKVKTTSNDVAPLDAIGTNNVAELKDLGLLRIETVADNENYKKMIVKINDEEEQPFFVDIEKEPTDANSTEGYGGVVSTSYIRGRATNTKAILSPWEVGFIHRGSPYQTLNIKYFKKDATEIGLYEEGDANIFDYLRVAQRETDHTVKDVNRLQMRGLVNLKNVSRQNGSTMNSGNIPAAMAFFSRIELGWTVQYSDDTFKQDGTPIAENATDSGSVAANIVKELLKIVDKPNFVLKSRSAILDPSYTDLQKVLVTGATDSAREELIGKFILLTTADTTEASQFADFMVVVAIAQRIQITSTVLSKDWLRDGSFEPLSAASPSDKKGQTALIEAGYGYRDINKFWCFSKLSSAGDVMNPSEGDLKHSSSDPRLKFYPGYDKILATQKVVAWLRKNNNGKWYIERLDYVD